MTNQSPIVSHQGIPRTYTVAVSEESIKHRNSWQGYWDLIRLRINFDSFMSASEFQSFDRDGNARSPNNAWVKVELPWQRIIRRIRWQNGHTTGRVRRFTLQGSNNNVNWDDLPIRETVAEIVDMDNHDVLHFEINNDTAYRFYRLVINQVHPWRTGSNVTHYAILESFSMCCEVIPAEKITIPSFFVLGFGEQKHIIALIEPERTTYQDIIWRSNDKSVATVDQETGLVTGIGHGMTTINATLKSNRTISENTRVMVGRPSPDRVTDVRIINPPDKPLEIGGVPYQLEAEVLPDTAVDKSIIWTNNRHWIVHVDKVTGLLTARNPGTATITAISGSNETESDRCRITTVFPQMIFISPESMDKGPGAGDYGMEHPRMEALSKELHAYLQEQQYKSTIGFMGFEDNRNRDKQREDVTTYRINPSNEGNYDLHIALHSNSGGGRGPETFHKNGDEESKNLSYYIQRNLFALYKLSSAYSNTVDRGIKYDEVGDEFSELSQTNAISSYIEVAFHDNIDDANWIINNMTDIAKAIGEGIITYIQKRFGNIPIPI